MSKLNALYAKVSPGRPVTSDELATLGVSADLAVHYVRAKWLTRLARGVFVRPDTPLNLHTTLRLLERRVAGLHVGGKSALDYHGVRHNVTQRSQLELYGWASGPLPAWFTDHFPSSYHRLRLFDEQPNAPQLPPAGQQPKELHPPPCRYFPKTLEFVQRSFLFA